MEPTARRPVPGPAATIFGRRTLVAILLLGAAGGGLGLLGWANRLPKRFAVVDPGRLYRCGSVSPAQLETLTRQYHLRTVLSLLNPAAPESVAERQAAQRLGLRWVNIPLRGNGASTPAQRAAIKAVLFDPRAGPTLVHCAAGTNRTGLAVGMYRLYRNGWTLEQVMDEMRRFGFEDLPRHANLRAALKSEWRAAGRVHSATRQPVP